MSQLLNSKNSTIHKTNIDKQTNTDKQTKTIGSIELIIGCMFAGKSYELIRRYTRYKTIQKKVLVINHEKDTRYGKNKVCSHNGDEINCVSVGKLIKIVKDSIMNAYDIIIIDEAQFFPDLIESCLYLAETQGKHVIVAGLSGDSDRRPFGDICKLIPYANDITFLKAYCILCNDGTPATFTLRTNKKSTDQLFVGSSESYQAVCRKCWIQQNSHV